MEKSKFKRILIPVVVAVAALVIGASSLVIIPAGHTGVLTNMGAVQQSVMQEGMNFKVPFVQNVVRVDNRVTKVEVPFTSASKDLQTVTGSVSVNYRISPDSSALVYKNFGTAVESTLVIPAIPECIKAVMARYSAEELITKRQAVSEEIKSLISEKIQSYGLFIEVFNMTDFSFSDEFNSAIEAKQTAQQNALKAEQDLARIKVEAQQKIEEARAEAESYKLKNQEITSTTLMNDWIEKWDGKLPQVSSDGSYMIDIGDLVKDKTTAPKAE